MKKKYRARRVVSTRSVRARSQRSMCLIAKGAACIAPFVHCLIDQVIHSFIQLKAQGRSRTCNESREEEEDCFKHAFHASIR